MASTNPSNNTALEPNIHQLTIPQEFRSYETIQEGDVIIHLEEWRRRAYVVLSDLQTKLQNDEKLSLDLQAKVVSAVAQFDGEGPWILETSREVARVILEPYDDPEIELLESILNSQIKPIFQQNPHPGVNPSTGRKLLRTADSLAQQDYYEGQIWKNHPGIPNLVSWCVRHAKGAAYEKLWHLIIPPVMTLLDDYEIQYKIQGTKTISQMLQKVPLELLRRTGMDGLILSSLTKCLMFLRNPDTPVLLRAVIPTCISLINATTAPQSVQRFQKLCALLGDGIIGNVWVYSSSEPETVCATIDELPNVVRSLSIGIARYLKAIIPQLTHSFISATDDASSMSLQLSSARALSVVIKECAPRMHNWKGTILDGVCRCWVTLVESGAGDNRADLKAALQDICESLAKACPSVSKEEFPRLLQADAPIFEPLLVPTTESR